MDTQQVEISGRNLLTSVLVAENFEVAQPFRDKGVDLIVYSHAGKEFKALPIQLKAARKETFSISKKYLQIPSLIMVYVWHVEEPQDAPIYIMPHSVAVKIAELHGYTNSNSWLKDAGEFSVNVRVSVELKKSLESYRYVPGSMKHLLAID